MIPRPFAIHVSVAVFLLCGATSALSSPFQPPHLLAEWSSNGATAFALAPDGTAYVATSAGRIAAYGEDGEFIKDWGSGAPGGFRSITGLAVSPRGLVYASEYYGNRIQEFDHDGRFLRVWGTRGKAAGQFDGPGGVTVDDRGTIYVVDRGNHRIQKFTSEGKYIASWGAPKGNAAYLELPVAIAVGRDGRVYVTDFNAGGIRVFTRDGRFLARWGPGPGQVPLVESISTGKDRSGVAFSIGTSPAFTPELIGTLCDSTTQQASGIAIDPSGAVYVVNSACGRVLELTHGGRFVGGWWIGGPPSNVGFGEAILAFRKDEVLVAQMDGHVRVFGRGPSHYESLLAKTIDPSRGSGARGRKGSRAKARHEVSGLLPDGRVLSA